MNIFPKNISKDHCPLFVNLLSAPCVIETELHSDHMVAAKGHNYARPLHQASGLTQ